MPTIKKLHPTLKACKCGMIGTRGQLYNHFSHTKLQHIRPKSEMLDNEYFLVHGEVPLNEDDPRTKVETQLKESLRQ